ncbi:calcium/sodium antiporter [Tepidicella baoligensis]|uniref:calcium/sodium antiporter n=1 Tax=Tepidicella baoligensis TaxID=2707016 RepID=UPI0015D9CFC0|nr:calcium/sodium antiporter [Tepidicella baoligensis]
MVLWLPLLAVLAGLAVLVWSADKFIDGSAAVARHFALPPLLIGVVIIGFGTSAPELAVSVLSAMEGSPGIALGNAYGSNIANIALILGLTALISPIVVQSQILRKELPVLTAITLLAFVLVWDLSISRIDAFILLVVFAGLMAWSIRAGIRDGQDALSKETEAELDAHPMPIGRAWLWLAVGLVLLIASSRLLVWGAVTIAESLGVSELVIGLTVVAVGTSLPELASCIAAARKNEHDLAMGNILGSNLFNTLAVVGLASAIQPLSVEPAVLHRDMAVMGVLTLALFALGYGRHGQPGRISRPEGALLLLCFMGYTAWLLITTLGPVR